MKRLKQTMAIILSTLLAAGFVTGIDPGRHAFADPDPAPTANTRTVETFRAATVIDDFETEQSVAGWHAGDNVSAISAASSAPNTGSAFQGSKMLNAKSVLNLQNNVWRTVFREFSTPVDWSASRYVMMAFNHYGYLPNNDPYLVRIKLYSGSDAIEGIVATDENQWNKIGLFIGDWAGRNAVDKIEVSWQHAYDRANYPDDPHPYWPDPQFQIDYLHLANDLGWQFSYAGDAEGWTFNSGIVGPVVADSKLTFDIIGNDPNMTSAPMQLNADTNNVITIKLRNGTANTVGKIYWTTDTETGLSESKSRTFALRPNDAGFTEYKVYMIGQPNWTGSITHLRIDPAENPTAAGTIQIDGISTGQEEYTPVEHIGVVSNVKAADTDIQVEGFVPETVDVTGKSWALYEVAPYQYEADTAQMTPVATAAGPLADRQFRFQIPRFDGARDRYYSKFVVALADDNGGDPQYVDAPQYVKEIAFAAENRFPFPTARSKKGLQVQMVDDAEELGLSHAAINVSYNSLMYKTGSNPADTIEYVVDGETFFFRKGAVEGLDRQIKPLSDNDIIVNLILLMYDVVDPDSPNDYLIHPDAARGSGIVYAFNTTNAMGVKYFKAATEFLVDRYTRVDEKYGRAVGYIVGNEVDAQWDWANMGEKTVDQFMEQYERTVRIVYQAARKKYDNPRVYISLTQSWTQPIGSPATRYYKSRDVIDKMNALSKKYGDFPWHVAYHPYPENLFNPATWNDQSAIDSVDSPKVTFKNLHILSQYMGRPELAYGGDRRRIILSEQGFHSSDYSEEAMNLQAAAYAYAYYKTLFLDGIDSFILHRHVDHKGEFGLRLGLWTWDDGRAGANWPGEKKAIYNVFRDIDTDKSLQATEFAKPIIGIADWSEIVPGFDPNVLAQRTAPVPQPIEINKKEIKNQDLVTRDDFETGTDGWQIADNTYALDAVSTEDAYSGSGALEVKFAAEAKQWRGAFKPLAAPIDATASPYLNVAVKLNNTNAGDPYYIKIKAYSGLEVAEGIALVDPAKGWANLSLDLSVWPRKNAIDKIKVWAQSPTNRDWNGSMLIDDVIFSSKNNAMGGLKNIDISASMDTATLAVGSKITVDVTNRDSAAMHGEIGLTPIGDIAFSTSALPVEGLNFGQSKRFAFTVTSYTPGAIQGVTGVRFEYRDSGHTVRLAVQKYTGEDQVPANVKLLYNFENSTNGWTAGENSAGVSSVESFANGPTTPSLGSYVLEVGNAPVEANKWHAATVTPATALNMSDAQSFIYDINGYGGVGSAYETRLRLYSGTEVFEQVFSMQADRWNRITADISGWAFKNNVTKIEIAFRAPQSTLIWGGRFQLDYIGYVKP
ncbi:DUF5722 domain-containing protein [Paenibacillus mendelii]|uniref:DUF5722 domain-containing protein n=1 Tax=Paenibacillus mendelii TaxID=206163 RepID=A0ABV6JE93_9BACL|nr:DUF5722 domain-containing protein [Paenibacillus mendelii]MCQ6563364.1 DUF5722 domain-containing protein [Paenibacillus mendelii]